ncbi:tRNA (N(6)-L-threonylcarbamoyladenosine(37)-C(2))-methylthiotransferase MtaB [Thiocystis violacea]|uniref:tRNA (N(6)-L-threonylcarbamoyladenosine(37)-C(2))- methylthiotransferase MtaB n=1 Tax=Thiocystis violacea TaxID=13725 RepID=UPI0019044E7A|nr:tRNA (N(6)-L-threonylcarbamoyladenosine(37)-C(2))-methylthiotransferase MtaB [Thiocystis violacea]
MNQPRRVQLQTLGCRLNEAELESWAQGFLERGLQVVEEGEPADLVVINTCAVTQEAVRKSRQILRRCHRANPGARLVISGCLASLEGEAVAREAGVDLIVANRDKDYLVEVVLDTLDLPVMPELAITDIASPLLARGRQRAFIKVQDGCRYRCTFCITTQARGEERSRLTGEILESVRRFQRAGIHEVVLTGVHLGGYGGEAGTDLGGLIARILNETEIPRIRLGSLEPWDLPDGFWSLFADGRLMPHLHLPLQSGSDAVLRRMARRCKRDDFARLVERGRAVVPDLNVTTDIIVGFPGETDEDWRQTLDLAATMRFGQIHVFGYSPRAGTLAADLPERVDARTRKARCEELQRLASRMRLAVLREQIGKRASLLHESLPVDSAGTPRCGYTPNFLPVHVLSETPLQENRLLEVRLLGVAEDDAILIAEPLG